MASCMWGQRHSSKSHTHETVAELWTQLQGGASDLKISGLFSGPDVYHYIFQVVC